jgi:hypothetical protein
LSINFSGHVIFSPKVSIGLAENGRFYNITFGKSFSSDINIYPNQFVELQFGALSEHFEYRNQSLFIGSGIGFFSFFQNRTRSFFEIFYVYRLFMFYKCYGII